MCIRDSLYSSLHIAIGALLFAFEAYMLYRLPVDKGYLALVFCSTLLIYSLHRIIGIKHTVPDNNQGRFAIIRKYKNHIAIYAALAFVGCLVSIIFTPIDIIILLCPIGLISLAYVLPILNKKRRLRDLNLIKIFLIAVTWAYVGSIPLAFNKLPMDILVVSFLEKTIFILLITLPFDIRDIKIDRLTNLTTIPIAIGVKSTYILCYCLFIIGLTLFYFLDDHILSSPVFVLSGLIIYTTCFFAIEVSKNKVKDIYYGGLIDGTLVIRGVVIFLASLH